MKLSTKNKTPKTPPPAPPVFGWKEAGGQFKKHDPQVIGEALEDLRLDGLLDPDNIVAAARSPRSPLHRLFPWDDAEAAAIGRARIAGDILRSLTVRIERVHGTPIETRAFVSVRTTTEARHFTSIDDAMSDADRREMLLQSAWNELQRWRARYGALQELSEVFLAIDAARGRAARKAG